MDVLLVMFRDDGTRKEFPLASGKTLVGRSEECDLRIPLPEISRKHSLLIVSNSAVTVRDLGSANGTYVNNKRISEQELEAGDHLVIGPVVFTVRVNGEPQEIRPVHTRLETRSANVTRKMPSAKPSAAAAAAPAGEEDPISALEALAGTDDTAAMDLDGSSVFGEEPV